MYPVVAVSGEVSKMEVVHIWHTSYAGFASKRSGVCIQVRECPPRDLPPESVEEAAEPPCSPGQAQLDLLLSIVQRFESEILGCPTWLERRNLLGQLRVDLELSDEVWRFAYAMFMARNPSEIPHRRTHEKRRRMIENASGYAGTNRKEGRNLRHPDEMCFSVQIRQKQLFHGWIWPQDHVTDVKDLVDIGPHDERIVVTPHPPRGETWNTILDAQKTATQSPWSEEWQLASLPKYGSPVPALKTAWSSVLGVPRKVGEVPQRVVGAPYRAVAYKRNRDWTLNVMAIARSRWPNVWGRMYVRETVKGLCERTGSSDEL